jgi:hypothetical protein
MWLYALFIIFPLKRNYFSYIIRAIQKIFARFSPKSADVWISKAVVVVGENQASHVLQVSGMGKYPHITASKNDLDFGKVLIGNALGGKELEFTLKNHTIVHATFEIERVDNDVHCPFIFSSYAGVVPSNGTIKLKIKFVPVTHGVFSCERFVVKTPGGNTVELCCTGLAAGPLVNLGKTILAGVKNLGRMDVINFGDVEIGNSVTRGICLRNTDNVPATFQFIVENNGVFAFDHPQGVVQAGLEVNLTITFRPREPANYYRRIFCIFHNQAPKYLDIMGTAFDEKRRPMPLKERHIYAFRRRRRLGYGRLSPDEIEELMASSEDVANRLRGSDEEEKALEDAMLEENRSGGIMEKELACLHEFFEDSNDSGHEIVVEETVLDFGPASRTKPVRIFHEYFINYC